MCVCATLIRGFQTPLFKKKKRSPQIKTSRFHLHADTSPDAHEPCSSSLTNRCMKTPSMPYCCIHLKCRSCVAPENDENRVASFPVALSVRPGPVEKRELLSYSDVSGLRYGVGNETAQQACQIHSCMKRHILHVYTVTYIILTTDQRSHQLL